MDDHAKLAELVDTLSRLKPPVLVKPEDTHVCMCGRRVPASVFTMVDTGVMRAVNNVCPDCVEGRREDTKLARIACCTCKAVVARMVPHKDRDGFEFKANHTYHIGQCGACTPGLDKSDIIEKAIYKERMR